MFLFEGEFGNVLHTGDCRLDSDCLQSLPLKYITKKGKETLFRLDYLFLDCTFARCFLSIPSKQIAIQQVINCIWNHPDAPVVYLACDLLGQEEILVEVSKTFGSKIYVDKSTNAQCLQALSLIAPEILSEDASSRFQVFSFTNLYEKVDMKLAEARESIQHEPLFIRPSTQWYACDESSGSQSQTKLDLSKALKDEHGLWHICYSMHSSREELEAGLQLLQPKWVISTTPPCRAMELDYVKRHCFKTQIDSDDPLWKLLKYAPSHSKTSLPKADSISNASPEVCEIQTCCVQEERQLQSKQLSMNRVDSIVRRNDEPISKQMTLFGRARLGTYSSNMSKHDSNILHEETSSADIKPKQVGFLPEDTTVLCEVALPDTNILVHSVSDPLHVDKLKDSHYHQSSQLQDCSVHHSSHELKNDNIEDHCPNNIRNIEETKIEKESSSCTIGSSSKDLNVNIEDHYPNNIRSEETKIEKDSSSCIVGSSKSLNPSLRKLYRSMNVPVPRPLPSLTKLMDFAKRSRTRY